MGDIIEKKELVESAQDRFVRRAFDEKDINTMHGDLNDVVNSNPKIPSVEALRADPNRHGWYEYRIPEAASPAQLRERTVTGPVENRIFTTPPLFLTPTKKGFKDNEMEHMNRVGDWRKKGAEYPRRSARYIEKALETKADSVAQWLLEQREGLLNETGCNSLGVLYQQRGVLETINAFVSAEGQSNVPPIDYEPSLAEIEGLLAELGITDIVYRPDGVERPGFAIIPDFTGGLRALIKFETRDETAESKLRVASTVYMFTLLARHGYLERIYNSGDAAGFSLAVAGTDPRYIARTVEYIKDSVDFGLRIDEIVRKYRRASVRIKKISALIKSSAVTTEAIHPWGGFTAFKLAPELGWPARRTRASNIRELVDNYLREVEADYQQIGPEAPAQN